jgi:hypothetical protein
MSNFGYIGVMNFLSILRSRAARYIYKRKIAILPLTSLTIRYITSIIIISSDIYYRI